MLRVLSAILCISWSSFSFGQDPYPFSKNGLWGYQDGAGSWSITPQFHEAQWFTNGRALVRTDGDYYFIDSLGERVSPIYFSAKGFNGNYAQIYQNGQWFLIDNSFQVVTEGYDHIDIEGSLIFGRNYSDSREVLTSHLLSEEYLFDNPLVFKSTDAYIEHLMRVDTLWFISHRKQGNLSSPLPTEYILGLNNEFDTILRIDNCRIYSIDETDYYELISDSLDYHRYALIDNHLDTVLSGVSNDNNEIREEYEHFFSVNENQLSLTHRRNEIQIIDSNGHDRVIHSLRDSIYSFQEIELSYASLASLFIVNDSLLCHYDVRRDELTTVDIHDALKDQSSIRKRFNNYYYLEEDFVVISFNTGYTESHARQYDHYIWTISSNELLGPYGYVSTPAPNVFCFETSTSRLYFDYKNNQFIFGPSDDYIRDSLNTTKIVTASLNIRNRGPQRIVESEVLSTSDSIELRIYSDVLVQNEDSISTSILISLINNTVDTLDLWDSAEDYELIIEAIDTSGNWRRIGVGPSNRASVIGPVAILPSERINGSLRMMDGGFETKIRVVLQNLTVEESEYLTPEQKIELELGFTDAGPDYWEPSNDSKIITLISNAIPVRINLQQFETINRHMKYNTEH